MNRFESFNEEELGILVFLLKTRHDSAKGDMYAEALQEQSKRDASKAPIIIGLSGIDAPAVR